MLMYGATLCLSYGVDLSVRGLGLGLRSHNLLDSYFTNYWDPVQILFECPVIINRIDQLYPTLSMTHPHLRSQAVVSNSEKG